MEGRGTAYLFSCLGGDWGWVKEVSILPPSHLVAQWSIGMGVMAYTPSKDDLRKSIFFPDNQCQLEYLKGSETVMGKGVLTAWVHSEGH